jgi:predicted MarR family transcription regulator
MFDSGVRAARGLCVRRVKRLPAGAYRGSVNVHKMMASCQLFGIDMTARSPAKSLASARKPTAKRGPAGRGASASESVGIVSSAHLVSPRSRELSEFEFGLIVAWNAYSRWAVHCMAAAGLSDLAITDVNTLHHVAHRGRAKKLADLCLIQNIEDTHVVGYSLKKLIALGMVQSERIGKEVWYSASDAGRRTVEAYRDVRERCLIESMAPDAQSNAQLGDLARLLRRLSGQYDQAARSAASL